MKKFVLFAMVLGLGLFIGCGDTGKTKPGKPVDTGKTPPAVKEDKGAAPSDKPPAPEPPAKEEKAPEKP